MAYRVKAGAVVAVVGGSDRYFEKGVVLPDGVGNIDHLLEVGLVTEVDVPVIEDGAELVEGAPVVDAGAPTVKAESTDGDPEPVKPQARKPAAK